MGATSSSKSYTPTRGRYRGRSFGSKHEYRNALAKARGFKSDYARRTVYKRISSLRDLNALSPKSRQKRNDALNVVGIMRRSEMNLAQAVKEHNRNYPDSRISVSAMKKYAKPALVKRGGRIKAKSYDRLLRVMRVPSPFGAELREVKDSRTASQVAKYENAVKTYLYTGDESQLGQFQSKYFRSNRLQYRFITDTDILDRLAEFGELEFESIYTQLDGE